MSKRSYQVIEHVNDSQVILVITDQRGADRKYRVTYKNGLYFFDGGQDHQYTACKSGCKCKGYKYHGHCKHVDLINHWSQRQTDKCRVQLKHDPITNDGQWVIVESTDSDLKGLIVGHTHEQATQRLSELDEERQANGQPRLRAYITASQKYYNAQ